MFKKIFLVVVMTMAAFGQTLSDFVNSGTKASDMKLSVDQPYGHENTRREVYGKLLGKFTPGYKNYYFYMTEDELNQAILANKIVADLSAVKTVQGSLYTRNQPTGAFIHYNAPVNKLYPLNFTEDIEGIKKAAFQGLSYLKPIYRNDYKELVVEPNASIPTEWEFHFLLCKENSFDAKNTNPYRLIAVTMIYRDMRVPALGSGVYPVQKDVFKSLTEKIGKQLGTPYAKENYSFSNYISRSANYYFQDARTAKSAYEEGALVGRILRGRMGIEINVTSLQIGRTHANFSVSYADPHAMTDLMGKMERAVGVQELSPQQGLPDFQ